MCSLYIVPSHEVLFLMGAFRLLRLSAIAIVAYFAVAALFHRFEM